MPGTVEIKTHHSVNGIAFGCAQTELAAALASRYVMRRNYNGEIEYLCDGAIFRCMEGRFVECTFPDDGKFKVDGVRILSLFDWLEACADVVDRAKFRISLNNGVAYDYRQPKQGSVTIFERGHWDGLV